MFSIAIVSSRSWVSLVMMKLLRINRGKEGVGKKEGKEDLAKSLCVI